MRRYRCRICKKPEGWITVSEDGLVWRDDGIGETWRNAKGNLTTFEPRLDHCHKLWISLLGEPHKCQFCREKEAAHDRH